jgi:hypothetical protein
MVTWACGTLPLTVPASFSPQVTCMNGTSAHMHDVVESSMESYVCRDRHVNGTRTYNELATIMHVTGEDAVRSDTTTPT